MRTIDIREVKSMLSRLVSSLESGEETGFIITRNGSSAAYLTAITPSPTRPRLDCAKGQFVVPESIDADSAIVAAAFLGAEG